MNRMAQSVWLKTIGLTIIVLLTTSAETTPAAPQSKGCCEAAKIDAAGDRSLCLAKEQEKARLGKPSNPAKCETEFDQAIAMIDANAAKFAVTCRYVDNGDGTIGDLNTLLQWEKKVIGVSTGFDSQGIGNCLWCVGDVYNWNVAMSDWLSTLNGRIDNVSLFKTVGFAGHS